MVDVTSMRTQVGYRLLTSRLPHCCHQQQLQKQPVGVASGPSAAVAKAVAKGKAAAAKAVAEGQAAVGKAKCKAAAAKAVAKKAAAKHGGN